MKKYRGKVADPFAHVVSRVAPAVASSPLADATTREAAIPEPETLEPELVFRGTGQYAREMWNVITRMTAPERERAGLLNVSVSSSGSVALVECFDKTMVFSSEPGAFAANITAELSRASKHVASVNRAIELDKERARSGSRFRVWKVEDFDAWGASERENVERIYRELLRLDARPLTAVPATAQVTLDIAYLKRGKLPCCPHNLEPVGLDDMPALVAVYHLFAGHLEADLAKIGVELFPGEGQNGAAVLIVIHGRPAIWLEADDHNAFSKDADGRWKALVNGVSVSGRAA